MILEQAFERKRQIQDITARANLSGQNQLILDVPADFAPEWQPDKDYTAGKLLSYNGVKYLVIQAVRSLLVYPPDMSGGAMAAIYKPYQGGYGYEWLAYEYTEVGFTRFWNGKLYECISPPNANNFPPDTVGVLGVLWKEKIN